MNNFWFRPLLVLLTITPIAVSAQTTAPVSDASAETTAAIGKLRAELVDSFNHGDVDGVLSHLDPQAVITWQDGTVCPGPQAVRDYYAKMLKNDHPIVSKLTVDPVVQDRHVYGDWAVSVGNLHDSYVLSDGSQFRFDSHFTATIARRGPVWKVVSFHASVNAFDNPILGVIEKKLTLWVGLGAGLLGVLLGAAAVLLLRRKRVVV